VRNWQNIRAALGFLPHQKVVLSVGAVKAYHKPMDYVINEMALLGNNFFLVILGQFDIETPALIEMAEVKLPGRHIIKKPSRKPVARLLCCCRLFCVSFIERRFSRGKY
jgi:hypothetical protein